MGFDTPCDQVVYFKPSLLKLAPGLRYKWTSFGDEHDFDRDRARFAAPPGAAPGRPGEDARVGVDARTLIGPFRYEGTRADDPNDVVPHEDRRELRASRVLAAWVGHTDSHEFNTVDRWLPDREGDDASPGHVVHSFIDWGDCLGNDWPQEEITRRMGYSYILDWGDMASDFATLGARVRPWEGGRVPGHELFGYFDVAHFVPDGWKNEYPNPAFSRMTERDAAWMARILARFTPEMVRVLAEAGRFSDPRNTEYVAQVLQGRLDRILERYLTRLSSITDVEIDRQDRLCGLTSPNRGGSETSRASATRRAPTAAWSSPWLPARGLASASPCREPPTRDAMSASCSKTVSLVHRCTRTSTSWGAIAATISRASRGDRPHAASKRSRSFANVASVARTISKFSCRTSSQSSTPNERARVRVMARASQLDARAPKHTLSHTI